MSERRVGLAVVGAVLVAMVRAHKHVSKARRKRVGRGARDRTGIGLCVRVAFRSTHVAHAPLHVTTPRLTASETEDQGAKTQRQREEDEAAMPGLLVS